MAVAGRWYESSLSGFSESVLPSRNIREEAIGVGRALKGEVRVEGGEAGPRCGSAWVGMMW